MRMRAAGLGLLALLLWLCAPRALAQAWDWSQAYGGRSEDNLRELIPAGDGLLAAGTTFSSDGDLKGRVLTGETGWALRLNAQGGVVFSMSTARSGRTRMHGAYAHADGTFSLALSGEDAGSEWLRLDAQGRVQARIDLPEASALCAHGPAASVRALGATEAAGRPAMALCVAHADGSRCYPLLLESGGVLPGAREDTPGEGALLRVGGEARVAWAEPAQGALRVGMTQAGAQEQARVFELPVSAGEADGETREPVEPLDAVILEDGSVLLSAGTARGGVLARVSAAGQALFLQQTEAAARCLAATRSGFAAATEESVLFFTEEGTLLGARPASLGEGVTPVDMAPLGEGVALLGYEAHGRSRQAHVAAAGGYTVDACEAYAGALYARMDSRLLEARAEADGARLLVRDEDGQTFSLLVAWDGRLLEEEPAAWAASPRPASWEAAPGGAQVTRLDAAGAPRWSTRVPVKTAADRIEFAFALELEDGALLLGGSCVTDGDGRAAREAVLAQLGEEGELRAVTVLEGYEAVLAAARRRDGLLLLLQTGQGACVAAMDERGRLSGLRRLDVAIGRDAAALLEDGFGRLLAAGTALRAGRSCAVVQRVEENVK